MNTLKELVTKIYTDLKESDWIRQYSELTEKGFVWDIIQWIALDLMPNFIEKGLLEDFVNESKESYTEITFKKYITNYSEFLNDVEQEFYNWLLIWLVEV